MLWICFYLYQYHKGQVWRGFDMLNHEDVAIKLEAGDTLSTHLWREAQIYEQLGGCIGFPKLYWYGSHEDDNEMVIDLLGASLEQVFNLCGRKFSLKTVLILIDQMASIFYYYKNISWILHSYHLVHCNLKPENFLLGVNGSAGILHLIDLGLSTEKIHPITGEHIPYKDGQKSLGTICYLSCNAHMGIQQSQCDDLEAIVYIKIYFLHGSLPWLGIKGSKEKKYRLIKKKKLHTTPAALCHGLPKEFHDFLLYTRSLAYNQDPDYFYICNLFRNLAAHHGFLYNYSYDWTRKN
ncbi:hypothetical protein SERLADRAFT_344757 [Serpula lacrymans var. lacrymans S7.9]|uniref:Protein kinase domain-containing protein n=1 Tax=Serpula lacrymans var. lacrymans (strain S7.9) TaxID=578457 RepID=F8NDQ3_SERL9|nr:uncharacterized protein SERLADRAFT_344757 [Serpula lacrymans var. lacrymans S7.9]EGO30337.1 hypothetical protein SERLADRAFT_344757 [Serpula lacrymans var. lacrymans S7.9]